VNSSTFKIFFLCEDAQSLDRAIALKEKLAKNCCNQVLIEADFCEYARLCHPRLRENATAHAIDADMIIVSARGTDAVPMFVQNWMSEIGALCSEKIVCAEFLHAASIDKATVFHRFMDKWASQSNTFLFSNLFPDSRLEETETVLG
jgi:hypothetical protein